MSVEKPEHVDATRMRHISDADLLTALNAKSLAALKERKRPRPVWDPARWAASDPASGKEVVAEADALLTREVDFTDRGLGRSRLYGFHYLGWLNPLTQAYALTGEPKYAACFDRLFGQWYDCRDDVVGDWPGLDVIWYSLGVATRSAVFLKALAVFGGELTRWADLVKSVVGGARWAFEEHDSFRYGNWQLFSMAELLHVAALFPECDEAKEWESRARQRLLDHLELDVYADGGHHERSPGYHAMCLEALQRAAVIGEQYLGWQLVEENRLRAMHDWLVTLSTDAGWIPHLQDSGVVWPAKLLLRGDYLHPGRGYGALARQWLTEAEVIEERSWLPPAPPRVSAGPEAGPGQETTVLPTSRYAIMRGKDLQTVINFGPHIGHELESHSHHASLDFVIAGWGVPLAWEAGGPSSYDDSGYYDWYQATRAHNTVQPAGATLSRDRTVTLDAFVTLLQLDVFAGHHDGYPARHDRRVVFVRADPCYWIVSDGLGAQGFVWRLHGRDEWLTDGAGFRVATAPGLLVLPAEPAAVTRAEHSIGPTHIPDPVARQARPGELHGLSLHLAGDRSDVLLVPFSQEPVPAGVTRDSDGTLVVRIGLFEDRLTGTTWSRSDPAKGLIAVAAWGAVPLAHAGRNVLDAPGLVAASLSYADGVDAVVEVDRRTVIMLHAPRLTELCLNGVTLPVEPSGDGVVAVPVPSAGRWRIGGTRWS